MAAFRRSGEQVDRVIVVELIDLKPATLCRQTPSEPIYEHLLPVMVHLHERRGETEAAFRKNQINHASASDAVQFGQPGAESNPGSYRVGAGVWARVGSRRQEPRVTAPFLPPIAHREKPPVVRRDFPRVQGRELATVPGKRGLPLFGILPEAVLDP